MNLATLVGIGRALARLPRLLYVALALGLGVWLIVQGFDHRRQRRQLRSQINRQQLQIDALQKDTTNLHRTIRLASINYANWQKQFQQKLDSANRSTVHLSAAAQHDLVLRLLSDGGQLR